MYEPSLYHGRWKVPPVQFLEFQPKEVYPYHYRGRPDVSDVAKFKNLVNEGNPKYKSGPAGLVPQR